MNGRNTTTTTTVIRVTQLYLLHDLEKEFNANRF